MSFNLGWDAFIKRLRERFPEPEYRWEDIDQNKRHLKNPSLSNDFQYLTFKCFKGDIEVFDIYVKLGFGIYLTLASKYLNKDETHSHISTDGHAFRVIANRPKTVAHCNQYKMRRYLQRKPKFAQMASKWGMQIEKNLLSKPILVS